MTVWLFPWNRLGSSGNGDRHGQSPEKPAGESPRAKHARRSRRAVITRQSSGSYLRSVSDLDGLTGNPHDFHRALGVARNIFRNAAQQETLHTFSPVGTQNDEICT